MPPRSIYISYMNGYGDDFMSNRLWLSGIEEKKNNEGDLPKEQIQRVLRHDPDGMHSGAGGNAYRGPAVEMPERYRLRNEDNATVRRKIKERISSMITAGDITGAEKLAADVNNADEWDFDVL